MGDFVQLFHFIYSVLPEEDYGQDVKTNDINDRQISRVTDLTLKPVIAPYIEPVRSYIKRAYKTYITLNPEVRFGQCIVKHFYVEYGPLIKFIQNNTPRKLIERTFQFLMQMMKDMMNMFFPTEIKNDMSKIMAMLTNESPNQRKPVPSSNLTKKSMPNQNYYYYPSVYGYQRRTKRQANHTPQANHAPQTNHTPHYFPQNQQSRQENSAETTHANAARPIKKYFEFLGTKFQIDASDRKTLEREADDIFNLDIILWKNLGLDDRSLQKYSMTYCGKEYIIGFFNRFIKNVILS